MCSNSEEGKLLAGGLLGKDMKIDIIVMPLYKPVTRMLRCTVMDDSIKITSQS